MMTSWTPELVAWPGPRYLALADALGAAIELGTLPPGTRLPTHRELADRLGVTVGTVTRGYAVAAERGLVEATVGRGTFVGERRRAPRMPDLQPQGIVDLAMNRPTIDPQVGALAATLGELASDGSLARFTGYVPSAGLPEHRAAGARFLESLGYAVPPERVIVTSGAQSALAAILGALTEPGDRIVTEWLGYPGIMAVAHQGRLRATGAAMDEFGLIPESFEEICRAEHPRLLVTVPTHHNPTATLMPIERRRAIAAIAREHDVLILEDDVYGFLIDERPPPIATFAPERTCYVACTSKPLMPGLRIGYVAAPTELVERIASVVRSTIWMAPPLMAEIATRWIDDGTAARLMTWQKTEARARQAIVEKHLGRFGGSRHPGGFHRWLALPEPWKVSELRERLRERGVAVSPSESFVVGTGRPPRAVRLCATAPADRDELERAVRTIAELLDHGDPYAPTTF